jgi:hypothetical protein
VRRLCRKIIGAPGITPAWGDATATTDAKWARRISSVHLPSRDGRPAERRKDGGRKQLVPSPYQGIGFEIQHAASEVASQRLGYTVITWSLKGGNFPSCFTQGR